jgi:hypothetical protein
MNVSHLLFVQAYPRRGIPLARFHNVFEGNVKPKRREIDKFFSNGRELVHLKPEITEKGHHLSQK